MSIPFHASTAIPGGGVPFLQKICRTDRRFSLHLRFIRLKLFSKSCNMFRINVLVNHVDGFLGDRIECGHRFGACLKCALGDDQVGEL